MLAARHRIRQCGGVPCLGQTSAALGHAKAVEPQSGRSRQRPRRNLSGERHRALHRPQRARRPRKQLTDPLPPQRPFISHDVLGHKLILGSLACGVIAMADGDILYGTDGSTLNDLQLNGSREKKRRNADGSIAWADVLRRNCGGARRSCSGLPVCLRVHRCAAISGSRTARRRRQRGLDGAVRPQLR